MVTGMSEASVVSQIVHDACVRAPVMMPEDAKWWEHLTADFPFRPEPFQLKARDALQVRASAAGDVLLRTLGATLVGTTALPFGYRPSRMQAAIADQHFYGRMAESRDPTVFFRAPPSGVRVRRRRAR